MTISMTRFLNGLSFTIFAIHIVFWDQIWILLDYQIPREKKDDKINRMQFFSCLWKNTKLE